MASIITYDIVNKHTEVKEAMYTLGYDNKFWYDNKWVYLPNTTLYHPTKTPTTGRDELRQVCFRLSVTLEKCFATDINNWAAYS